MYLSLQRVFDLCFDDEPTLLVHDNNSAMALKFGKIIKI